MQADRPVLHLYITRGCPVCERAEQVLRDCEEVQRLCELQVSDLGSAGVSQPGVVVGAPTTVFGSTVVALGTPDCSELVARLEGLIAASAIR